MKLSNAEVGTVLAGFLGSLVSLRFLGPMPWYERIILILCGLVATHYLTPLVIYYLGIPKFQQEAGFLVGVFGMSAMGAVLNGLTQIGAHPLALLKFLLSRTKLP